jgi:erythrin-vacuolar iron transport family protein
MLLGQISRERDSMAQKKFKDLTEREILALAISSEEEDGRIYGEFADGLRESYPATALMFEEMREEEINHRDRLFAMYRQRFGEHIPPIRRENVKGFLRRSPAWMVRPLGVNKVRKQAELMEMEAGRFYAKAIPRVTDAATRELLNKLADEERKHQQTAGELEEKHLTASAKAQEDESHRKLFLLQIVQPGLAGLMDGSVSTLAPLFAAAFATHQSWDAFRVGLAASIGAGISMAFAEGLSDDGSLTGRGSPWIRGLATGLMTTAGGVGHSLPFLIANFQVAALIAVIIVAVELAAIAYIRHRYMDTPLLQASFQVIVGGFLVFLTGYFIGNA